VDVSQLDHAVIVQWRRGISACVNAYDAAIHIVNIDYSLKLSLITFISTFTTAIGNWNTRYAVTDLFVFFLCGILSLFGVV